MITQTRSQREAQEATIRSLLANIEFPPSLVEYRLEFVTDSVGDPAFWVYFILNDDLNDEEFLQEARRIKKLVLDPFWENEAGFTPYTSFRQKHEQDELDGEAKRKR